MEASLALFPDLPDPWEVAPSRSPALAFTVYGKPQPGGSKRGFYNQKTGRVIVTDANKKAAPWKAHATAAAAEVMEGRQLFAGPLLVIFTFVVARPQGHYGKRGLRASAPAHPTVRPDVLKLARLAEDSMTGIVYRDDAQIVREFLVKTYGEPERTQVEVWELG
jgi:Holliday junction resolvase RusA-like endonuclease